MSKSQETKFRVHDARTPDWYWSPRAVVRTYGKRIKAIGIAVYDVLSCESVGGECDLSIGDIAAIIGASIATVKRSLKTLKDCKLISITSGKGKGKPSIYKLLPVKTTGGSSHRATPAGGSSKQGGKVAHSEPPQAEQSPPNTPLNTNTFSNSDELGSNESIPPTPFVEGTPELPPTPFEWVEAWADVIGRDTLPADVKLGSFTRIALDHIQGGVFLSKIKAAAALYRAWYDALRAKTTNLIGWNVGVVRNVMRDCLGLLDGGVDADCIRAFVLDKQSEPYWQGRVVSWSYVAQNVASYCKGGRTVYVWVKNPNGGGEIELPIDEARERGLVS